MHTAASRTRQPATEAKLISPARFAERARSRSKLVAGPSVYICDECIDLCHEILAEE